jgi:hypothetical protein
MWNNVKQKSPTKKRLLRYLWIIAGRFFENIILLLLLLLLFIHIASSWKL